MAKKKSRPTYVSKGERRAQSTVNKIRNHDKPETEIQANKWNAFLAGKRVWFTIDNPNPNETRAKKIRVLGKDLYGDFRKYQFGFEVR